MSALLLFHSGQVPQEPQVIAAVHRVEHAVDYEVEARVANAEPAEKLERATQLKKKAFLIKIKVFF